MIDYQLHTKFSDGTASAEEMVGAAYSKGLTEIAITDHLIVSERLEAKKVDDLTEYTKELKNISSNSPIELKLGLEVDYFPDKKQRILSELKSSSLDFILLSVHYPHYRELDLFDGSQGYQEFVKSYYQWWVESVQVAVDLHLADSIGHADYFRRWTIPFYGKDFPFEEQKPMIREAIRYIVKSDLCIDVNTSGFRHGLNSTYPSREFLSFCISEGVRSFTISSDAHRPEDVGAYLQEAVRLLTELGIREVYSFSSRRPKAVPISRLRSV